MALNAQQIFVYEQNVVSKAPEFRSVFHETQQALIHFLNELVLLLYIFGPDHLAKAEIGSQNLDGIECPTQLQVDILKFLLVVPAVL